MREARILALALLGIAGCASDTATSADPLDNPAGNGGLVGTLGTAPPGVVTAKDNVYLAAFSPSLATGDYYFQVTDPCGRDVLSMDDISCRHIYVDNGAITQVFRSDNGCMHAIGSDQSGALTVQLMPFADTPNNGGVYKAWVTPIPRYDGTFEPRFSKMHNFQVHIAGAAPSTPDAC
jgi:hypothetical protein